MTITITFTDGTTATFTTVTAYGVANGVVSFTGTNADGESASWDYNLSLITHVKKTTATG